MGRSPYIWVRDETGDWHGTPKYLPVSEVPTCPTELDIETMHLYGADSQARGGFVAYAEWLRLINPPARSTPMGGKGQPIAPCP